MSEIQPFRGFSEAAQTFFKGLARNNKREWFEKNKQVYLDEVLAPAQALVAELGPQLAEVDPAIRYDTRTNGSGSIFRIYRDVRFSKDKAPYKTFLGVRFWTGEKKMAGGGYYFAYGPNGCDLYGGNHAFDKAQLTAYRKAVSTAGGSGLPELLAPLRKAGYEVGGEHYKRVPKGFPQDHPQAELLRYNGVFVKAPIPINLTTSRRLLAACLSRAKKMAALNGWMAKKVGH